MLAGIGGGRIYENAINGHLVRVLAEQERRKSLKAQISTDVMKEFPNKYRLTPKSIKRLRVKDWERLKEKTWHNAAIGNCWCHVCGCNHPGEPYDGFNEFWIGFYENGKIDYNFMAWGGMAVYRFDEFYDIGQIENQKDMRVQANALRYLNALIDEGIVEAGSNEPKKRKKK